MIGNRYKILSKLGSGGSGTVYKVLDTFSQNEVALKILKVHSEELKQEFSILKELNHPYVCSVFDYGFSDSESFFTMELLESKSLDFSTKIETGISVALKIAQGLHYIHSNDVTHFDLKPENILFDSKGNPKILDFGFSSKSSTTAKQGSIFFVAPEILQERKVDKKADLYSFGCLLYKMFTNQTPFDGKITEVLKAHISQKPKNPQEINSKVFDSLASLILQLLEKKPTARLQSSSDLVYRLAKILPKTLEFATGESKIFGREAELETLKNSILRLEKITTVNIFGTKGAGKTKLFEEAKKQAQIQAKIQNFENPSFESLSSLTIEVETPENEINTFFRIKDFLVNLKSKILFHFTQKFDDKTQKLLDFLQRTVPELRLLICFETSQKLKNTDFNFELQNLNFEEHTKQICEILYTFPEKIQNFNESLFKLTVGNPSQNRLLIEIFFQNEVLKISEIGLEFNHKKFETFNFKPFLEEANLLLWESLNENEKESFKLACLWELELDENTLRLLAKTFEENFNESTLQSLLSKRIFSSRKGKFKIENQGLRSFVSEQIITLKNDRLADFAKERFPQNPEFEAFHLANSKDSKRKFEVSFYAAQKMSNEKNFELAEIFYRQALSVKRFVTAKFKEDFADFLLALGKNKEAIEILKNEPNSYQKGLAFQREGNYEEAKSIFKNLLEKSPSLKSVSSLTQIEIYLSNFSEAEDTCKSFLDLNSKDPEIPTIFSLAGEVKFYQRKFEEAEKYFSQSLKLADKFGNKLKVALVSNSLGSLNDLLGEFEKAEKFYKDSEQIFLEIGDLAHLPLVYNNLGELYRKQSKWELSENFHLKSLELKKQMDNRREMAFSFTNLGVLFYFKNDLQTSVDYFKQALKIQEELADKNQTANLLSNIAEIYFLKTEFESSREFFEKAIELKIEIKNYAEVGEAYFFVGEIEQKLENFFKSKDAFFHALQFYNKAENREKHSEIYLKLSEIYKESGKIHEAESFVERGIEIAKKQNQEKQLVGLLVQQAKFLLEQNQVQECRRFLESKISEYEQKTILKVQFLALLYQLEKTKGSPLRALEIKNQCVKIDKSILSSLKNSANSNTPKKEELPTKQVKMNLSGERLKILFEVSQKINSILELDQLLSEILNLLVVTLGAEQGLVILTDKNNQLETKASWQLTKEDRDFSSTVVKESIEKVKTIFCPNVHEDFRFSQVESIANFQSLSLICTPLYSKGEKVIGSLYVDSRDFEHIFTDEDVEFLESFANLAVIALENSKQHSNLLIENKTLKQEVTSNYKFSKIIGKSPKMAEIFQLLESIIATPVTVLIEGESGTGKELVAKAIHYNDPIRNKFPFVAVNCGALPESILESELFGHTKGSFTGAIRDKEGIFEHANNGTIFLDEIGEMSQLMQVKLLRVLQEREITKVGDSRPIKIDVRFVCATNKNLEEEVTKGNFREDLFYRINVIKIKTPSLSERIDDIPLLAEHFLKIFTKRMNRKNIKKLSEPVIDALTYHSWKGNVRELENIIERAVVLCNEDEIEIKHLPEKLRKLSSMPDSVSLQEKTGDLRTLVSKFERNLIIHYLNRADWNIEKASTLSGLPKRTFQRKKKDYKIINAKGGIE
ncbi:MAG: GAF domain-containing protein [Calditrichaeota bacterium]|nr:MAG: GAF domain-containing protein [Calditrichota bacterium]